MDGLTLCHPITDVHPNPWNPNEMTDRQRQAVRESLFLYGFTAPIVCRTKMAPDNRPAAGDLLEIIDGEHRHIIFGDIIRDFNAGSFTKDEQDAIDHFIEPDPDDPGNFRRTDHPLLPFIHDATVPVVNMGVVDDAAAKKLTVILNETRGEPSMVNLARLLHELSTATTVEDLMKGLPYGDAEMEEMLAIGAAELNVETADDLGGGDGGDGEPEPGEWVTFEIRMTAEAYETFKEAKQKSEDDAGVEPAQDEKTACGHAVEALAAHFLAG